MKTNLVLALLASTTLLSACGGFSSSIGPGQLGGGVLKPSLKAQNESALTNLDGSEYSNIQDPADLPSITSLSLKLSGKVAPFKYQITMTPKGMDQRTSSDQIVVSSDKAATFSIISESVVVQVIENGACVSLTVPNQKESVFFNDVETLSAPIVLCK